MEGVARYIEEVRTMSIADMGIQVCKYMKGGPIDLRTTCAIELDKRESMPGEAFLQDLKLKVLKKSLRLDVEDLLKQREEHISYVLA